MITWDVVTALIPLVSTVDDAVFAKQESVCCRFLWLFTDLCTVLCLEQSVCSHDVVVRSLKHSFSQLSLTPQASRM